MNLSRIGRALAHLSLVTLAAAGTPVPARAELSFTDRCLRAVSGVLTGLAPPKRAKAQAPGALRAKRDSDGLRDVVGDALSSHSNGWVTVYHKGELAGGRVSAERPYFSTGTDEAGVDALDRDGEVHAFRIPKAKLAEWLATGKARKMEDRDSVTGVVNSEIRFYGQASQELNQYRFRRAKPGAPIVPAFQRDNHVFELSGDDGHFMAQSAPSLQLTAQDAASFTLRRVPVKNPYSNDGPRLAWESFWSSQPGALQGDPRNLAIIYGIETARAFGVEVIDGNYARIPKRAAVNRGIERVNAHLPDERKIDVVYYDLRETRDVGRIYTQGLARRDGGPIRLPYSDDPNLAIHDASFHLAGMAIPRPVWDHVAATADAIDRFATFLEKRGHADLAKQILDDYSGIIDRGHGDLSSVLKGGNRPNILNQVLKITMRRKSPKDSVAQLLRSAVANRFQTEYLRAHVGKEIDPHAQLAAGKAYIASFESLAAEFAAQNPLPGYDAPFKMGDEALLEALGRNIESIQVAATHP